MHSATFHLGNTALDLIVLGVLNLWICVTVLGTAYPIDQVRDGVVGPVAGFFYDLLGTQPYDSSLHALRVVCHRLFM